MRFRLGLVVGFAGGYVLGARAGRARYEEIVRSWNRLTGSPAVQRAAERTRGAAGDQARRTLHAVQHGVERAGTAVKERLNRGDGQGIVESWPGPGIEGAAGGPS